MKPNQYMSKLADKIKVLRRDFFLFLKTPKAYLFSFTFSSQKKIEVKPYDPEVTSAGKELVAKIQSLLPNLKVHFVGAASLGIAQGDGDIDLLIESPHQDFDTYLPKLTSLLGEPDKKREKFIEWHTIWKGYQIELALSDPSSPIIQEPLAGYALLKNNPKYLKEYEQIKISSNGLSEREYKKRKLEFFNRVAKI